MFTKPSFFFLVALTLNRFFVLSSPRCPPPSVFFNPPSLRIYPKHPCQEVFYFFTHAPSKYRRLPLSLGDFSCTGFDNGSAGFFHGPSFEPLRIISPFPPFHRRAALIHSETTRPRGLRDHYSTSVGSCLPACVDFPPVFSLEDAFPQVFFSSISLSWKFYFL